MLKVLLVQTLQFLVLQVPKVLPAQLVPKVTLVPQVFLAQPALQVLLVLRVLARTLPQRQISDVEVWWRDPEAAPRIERVLQSTDGACRLKRLEQDPQTGLHCRLAQVRTRDLGGVRALGEGLSRTPGVVGWSITPHDP